MKKLKWKELFFHEKVGFQPRKPSKIVKKEAGLPPHPNDKKMIQE